MNLEVVNLARSGRSVWSYNREGLLKELLSKVQAGDYVVIEFGYNDGCGAETTSFFLEGSLTMCQRNSRHLR